jgi:hypothetical protein
MDAISNNLITFSGTQNTGDIELTFTRAGVPTFVTHTLSSSRNAKSQTTFFAGLINATPELGTARIIQDTKILITPAKDTALVIANVTVPSAVASSYALYTVQPGRSYAIAVQAASTGSTVAIGYATAADNPTWPKFIMPDGSESTAVLAAEATLALQATAPTEQIYISGTAAMSVALAPVVI